MEKFPAKLLQVIVGEENPTILTLALFTMNGIKLAMFAAQQPESESWFPIPLPPPFVENKVLFQTFTADLADKGYILECLSNITLQ